MPLSVCPLVDQPHPALAEDADDAVVADAVGARGERRVFLGHPANLPAESGLE